MKPPEHIKVKEEPGFVEAICGICGGSMKVWADKADYRKRHIEAFVEAHANCSADVEG